MFKYNPFKSEIIRTKVPDNTRTTVYRCGDLIDLCRGPHVRHTGQVKSMKCINHSATQWLAKEGNDQLQRMYGVSFPDKAMMKVWEENRQKAKERDHRLIGEKQKLVSNLCPQTTDTHTPSIANKHTNDETNSLAQGY